MALTSRLAVSSSAAVSSLGLALAGSVLSKTHSSSVASAFWIWRPCSLTLRPSRCSRLRSSSFAREHAKEHLQGSWTPQLSCLRAADSCQWHLHAGTRKYRRWCLEQSCRHLSTRCKAAEVEPAEQSCYEIEVAGEEEDPRIPVTVITGYLGSGKTTLLNYILMADHGKRIAVIENEFGEVDIDGDLVATKRTGAEDIIMLNNGCLCCTVRGDLVRMILELVRTKRDRFDHIIIETTGLANPAPVIQTFFIEDEIAMSAKLDGVVTVVDAKHVSRHIDEVKPDGVVNEVVEQIAFADRIILNKVDLVDEKEMGVLKKRIQRINGMARVKPTKYGVVDIDYVLGVGGFDLERVEKEVQPELLDEKKAKNANLAKEEDNGHSHLHAGHAEGHDHDHDNEHDHSHDHHHEHDHHHHHHDHDHDNNHGHDHVHDPGVTSVSIVCEGELDLERINDWLGDLLQERSDDLYRMKGVLAIKGSEERFVFQGVHALFEGSPDRPWEENEKRTNRIVFIGKDLDKEELTKGFQSCLLS